jgi:uncharacterized membrane protein HdeD (DUF308 family)
MNAASTNPALLFMKKMGGLVSVLLGGVLLTYGAYASETPVALIGALLIIVGAVLLALKIMRRNVGQRGR